MMYFHLFISLVLTLVLTACGSGGGGGSPGVVLGSTKTFNPNAFNSYDSSTFATSTCTNLPIPIPAGVFAATNGRSNAVGTQDDPLDLSTALSASSPVQPGETLWLVQGEYKGTFTSYLQGTVAFPIEVRPLPGEQVVISTDSRSGAALRIKGAYTNYYGLEVLSTSTQRQSQQDTSSPSDIPIASGVVISGADHVKFINGIVHDNVGGGIDFWSDSYESDLYGNIIYNNGWTAPGRGHGHAVYAQNNSGTGTKILENNVIFFGFGTGIHIYTQSGQMSNFTLLDNTWFMTGASDPRSSQRKDNCLVGGYQPVVNLVMNNNQGFSMNSRGTRLGYGSSVTGQSASLNNNYLSENFWVIGGWNTLPITNTTVHRGLTEDASTYITDGISGNSVSTTPPGSGKKIFIKENDYDPRRAKIVIYNFDADNSVDVDLSSVLSNGEAYRIHSVYDLFGDPLLEGVYSGGTIAIPMGNVDMVQPNGLDGVGAEDNPEKIFGTFILTHGGC